MTDHRHSSHDASFAADRLREVLDSMRTVWRKSLEETSNHDNPIDLFVVDADVVMMFMSPAKKNNYGALLRYEGHARSSAEPVLKHLETRVVEFLGNLIFFQLQSSIPLLLLPDHADDLERIMIRVWEAANTELGNWENTRAAIKSSTSNVIETSKRQLSDASDVVVDRNVAKEKRPKAIEGLLEEIFRSLRGEGDVGSLFRFDALGSSDRLCHLDRIALRDKEGQQRFFPPPLNAAGEYVAPVSHLAKRLFPTMMRLSGTNEPSKRFRLQRDAQALAHLAWLNELLAKDAWYIRTGGDAVRRVGRLVLITGSHLIPQAISELELKSLQGCVFAPLSFLGHRLMDEYFQRDHHGRQHNQMEDSTQGSQASALINFLDSMRGLLNNAIKSKNSGEISRALAEVRGKHSDMAESWQGRQLFGPHSRMKAISSAIEELEKSGKSLDGLEEFLETLSVEAWQSFARSVTKLNLKTAAPNQAVQRNIPPVLFEHSPTAQEISARLYQTGDNAAARDNATDVLTGPLIRKLKKQDPSHYTEFVCYALFGLVHRALRSAEGCAEIALSIAESEPTEGEYAKFIKGDEALYLLAHIIRLRARRKEHLDRAETCIDLAMKAARQCREIEGLEPVDDIRLESERFSIHCHQRYFECLGSVGRLHPMLRTSRDEDQLLATFNEGAFLLDKIQAPDVEKKGYVYEYVKQQLLVNLAQLGLLCVFPAVRTGDEGIEAYIPMEKNHAVKEYLSKFKAVTTNLILQCEQLHADESGKLPKSSTLSTCVATVAVVVFLGHREIDEPFSPKQGKVASIDGLRFKYLESVLNYLGRNADTQLTENMDPVIGNKQPRPVTTTSAHKSAKRATSSLHVHLKR